MCGLELIFESVAYARLHMSLITQLGSESISVVQGRSLCQHFTAEIRHFKTVQKALQKYLLQ